MGGVGPRVDLLKKRATSVRGLAAGFSPEGVVAPIEEHVGADLDGPIAQLHVCPFGGLRKSAAWLAERGSWFAVAAEDPAYAVESK